MTWQDLIALPCSHPHCSSVGFMVRDDAAQWRSLVGIIGHERLKEHLDLVSNRIVDQKVSRELRVLVKESLLGLHSERTSLAHPSFLHMFLTAGDGDLRLGTLIRMAGRHLRDRRKMRALLGERVKRITVKSFMDVGTMIEERLLQCCVHVGTTSETQHQCVPFCAAQAWWRLGEMKLAGAAGISAGAEEIVGSVEASTLS